MVGADNAMLMSAARQIFGAGGKRMRPALVFLVSRATSQLSGLEYVVCCDGNEWRLGQISAKCNLCY